MTDSQVLAAAGDYSLTADYYARAMRLRKDLLGRKTRISPFLTPTWAA